MIELKNMDTDAVITSFVSLKEKQEVILTLHQTLDGRQLGSRFGSPIITYELTVFVKDDGRLLLLSSQDELSLLRVTIHDKIYLGRIIKLGEFDRITREYFKVELTLAKEVDV
ncbi:MAG: hypothetical protein PHE51_02015 [Eubacteriales bacterium]|nr:hypothetical protein [Eubacteriales bacterium]